MLEMIVVMGIFSLVGGLALFVSMDTYRGSNFHSDRNTFIASLQRARTQSMNNICLGSGCTDGKPHGVKVLSGNTIVVFQGTSYATRDSAVDSVFALNIASATGDSEFVFDRLSGASTAASATLADDSGRTSVVTINSEGQISWTN